MDLNITGWVGTNVTIGNDMICLPWFITSIEWSIISVYTFTNITIDEVSIQNYTIECFCGTFASNICKVWGTIKISQ